MSFAVLYARCALLESRSSGLECKVSGKFHANVNMLLRPIANKYHEGNVKSTLKRELKEPALAEWKADRISNVWKDCYVSTKTLHFIM